MSPARWLVALGFVLAGCSSGSDPASPSPTPRPVTLSLAAQLTHGNDARAVVFSPDGGLLATAGGDIGGPGTIRVWGVPGFGEIETWEAYPFAAYALAFAPGGDLLVSSGYDADEGSVRLWQVPGATPVWRRLRLVPQSVAVSPDGSLVAVGGSETTIEILSLPDGDLVRSFTAHERSVLAVAFSADGRRLVSGGADHAVAIWSVPDFTEEARFAGHTAPVWSVALSPDGRYAASSGVDSSARVWSLSDGTAHRSYHQEDWVFGVAFSPDSTLLASAGYAGLRLYRVDGDLAPEFSADPPEPATAAAFSPDGQWLVTARADSVEATPGTVNVWSVER